MSSSQKAVVALEVARIELVAQNKADLLELGRERQKDSIQARDEKGRAIPVLSLNDKTGDTHNTRDELAQQAGMSTGKFAQG